MSTDLYTEGCSAVKHYSTSIMHIRTLTMIQGLTILGAVSLLIVNGMLSLVPPLTLFGLLFTCTLYLQHEIYFMDYSSHLAILSSLEKALFDSGGQVLPWTYHYSNHQDRVDGFRGKVRLRAPFVLFSILFIVLGSVLTHDLIRPGDSLINWHKATHNKVVISDCKNVG